MQALRLGRVFASGLCVAALLSGATAAAQSSAAQTPAIPAAATQAASARYSTPSIGMMPIPMPLFAPGASTTAPDPITGLSASSATGNMFTNPYAAPFLYNGMAPNYQPSTASQASSSTTQSQSQIGSTTSSSMGMSSAQMGLMMLATQRPMGLGSGQSSGGAADPLRARRSIRPRRTFAAPRA